MLAQQVHATILLHDRWIEQRAIRLRNLTGKEADFTRTGNDGVHDRPTAIHRGALTHTGSEIRLRKAESCKEHGLIVCC